MRRKCGSGSAPANCWHARPSHPGARGVVRLLVRTLGAWAVRAARRCPARERGRGADDVRDGSWRRHCAGRRIGRPPARRNRGDPMRPADSSFAQTGAAQSSGFRPMGPARPLALTIAPDGGTVVVGQSQRHCIAARLDGQGREVWASTLAGDGESACRAAAFDERTGDIWAAGEFTGTVGPTRTAGLTDAFVVRISGVTGEMRLVRTFGGKGAEHATALALTDAGDVIVAGTFGRDVDASLSEVNFGSGSVRAADGTDGFVVALQPDGTTRWVSVVGEHGDDEVVGVEARDSAVYAAANLHRARDGARCGGQPAVLRNHDWVRIEDDECVAVRALTFDDAGRLWVLENAGRTLRARAFASTDGAALG